MVCNVWWFIYGSYMDSGYNLLKEIMFFKNMQTKQHICTILIFQYVSKAVFLNLYVSICFKIYKSDISHFESFPRCAFPPLGLPLLFSRCVFPLYLPVLGSKSSGPFSAFSDNGPRILSLTYSFWSLVGLSQAFGFYLQNPGILSRALWSQTSWILSLLA